MSRYVYPELSNRDFGFFRVGGPGLANCLFVAARAYLLSRRLGCELLRPTWERLGIGQWIRREKDKRFYSGLFRPDSPIKNLRKALILHWGRQVSEDGDMTQENCVVHVTGLRNFFDDLIKEHDLVVRWLMGEILPAAIADVPANMKRSVAVHVRLGDYPQHFLTDLNWYVGVIKSLQKLTSTAVDIQLFSDGTDRQLSPLLQLPGVRRAFYGNALADMIAISRCGFVIGSDSTFSGWGAFLGQVPCVFSHLHYNKFGPLLRDSSGMAIMGDDTEIPDRVTERFL